MIELKEVALMTRDIQVLGVIGGRLMKGNSTPMREAMDRLALNETGMISATRGDKTVWIPLTSVAYYVEDYDGQGIQLQSGEQGRIIGAGEGKAKAPNDETKAGQIRQVRPQPNPRAA